MADRATPNLPARDFAANAAFYATLGFEEDYRDDGAFKASDVPNPRVGMTRSLSPQLEDSGLTIAYLIDPDGTLLRLIQNG
jgi:catechol 2,3-dioxygenase-like lactoylglutathione lyase family enzyme